MVFMLNLARFTPGKIPTLFVFSFLVLVVWACSPTSISSYPSLVNQGILPLSTNNAYNGANLFIAEESQHSQFLYNFLKGKGGPAAIEITEAQFSSAPHLILFYPRDKEVYAADLRRSSPTDREWIIRGPYAIERGDYRELAGLESSLVGEPLFIIDGRPFRFRFQSPRTQEVKPTVVPEYPTPVPTPKPKPPKKKTAPVITAHEQNIADMQFKPLNSDQQALNMAKGFAERASNGDVVHTAKGGESLAAVSKWYTGSDTHAADIALSNGLQAALPLAPGVRVKVPLKLLKQLKSMPADFH
jgi:hypothetical protein